MSADLWGISCPWGSVFAESEARAHEVADTYDRCCGCRRGLGPGPGSHVIARGRGNPGVQQWKAIETVERVPLIGSRDGSDG